MAKVKICGEGWKVPPSDDDLRKTSEELRDSQLHRHEPPNRGVTLEQHRRMMILAAQDKESIKELIPSD